jgi:FkbM family methyltransferase
MRKILISLISKVSPKLYNLLKEKNLKKGLPLDFLNALKLINTNSVCIDLGANIGEISSMMAKRGSTVYAFEPNSAAYILLEEKCKILPNINSIKKAAGITNRSVNLFLHSDNHGENKIEFSEASSIKSNKPNVSKENFEIVEELDFAEFLNNFEYIDIIKIDIEGYEIDLLNHLLDKNSLTNVRKVFVETHYHKWPELEKSTLELIKRVKKFGLDKKINFDWK